MSEDVSDKFTGVNYQDSVLEMNAQYYPEAMREPFLWLGVFTREECGKKLDVLEEKARRLGFSTTAGTFSKILRGLWNRNSRGQTLENPIMAMDNFLDVVKALKADSNLNRMAGNVPFVMTPTAKKIFEYIDKRRSPKRVNRFGLIVGPTGSQKTHSLKQYAIENNHGRCVWMEAEAHLGIMISKLADKYGVSSKIKSARKFIRIEECLNDSKTIIIENIQRLNVKAGEYGQPVFNWLQKVQDETGCTIILSATPQFHREFMLGRNMGWFEQFEGRCGGRKNFLVLPDYTPAADCHAIAKAFGLKDASNHTDYLKKIAQMPGRIRILFQVLQDAKQDADDDKQPLTIDYIRDIMDDVEEMAGVK